MLGGLENSEEIYLDRRCARRLQMELVLGFRNYTFAYDSWGLFLVPNLLDLPKIGSIRVSTGRRYYPVFGRAGIVDR